MLAPKLSEVFRAGEHADRLGLGWLPVILGAEVMSFWCIWKMQKMVCRGATWFVVVNSHLAGNAFNRITPLGGVTGAALQARLMTDAGIPATRAGSAMATQSILGSVGLGLLPLAALPLVAVTGTHLAPDLRTAARVAAAVVIVLLALAAWLLSPNAPLAGFGDGIDRATRRFRPDAHGLGERLVEERDALRAVLATRWVAVTSVSVGRWVCEWVVLLAILVGIGARPDPLLTLYALTIAALINLVPLTPGGLGLVELGLAGTLVATGVPTSQALLATLLFRLVTFWLPLPIGAAAGVVFRRRYPRSVLREEHAVEHDELHDPQQAEAAEVRRHEREVRDEPVADVHLVEPAVGQGDAHRRQREAGERHAPERHDFPPEVVGSLLAPGPAAVEEV